MFLFYLGYKVRFLHLIEFLIDWLSENIEELRLAFPELKFMWFFLSVSWSFSRNLKSFILRLFRIRNSFGCMFYMFDVFKLFLPLKESRSIKCDSFILKLLSNSQRPTTLFLDLIY